LNAFFSGKDNIGVFGLYSARVCNIFRDPELAGYDKQEGKKWWRKIFRNLFVKKKDLDELGESENLSKYYFNKDDVVGPLEAEVNMFMMTAGSRSDTFAFTPRKD